MKGTKSQEKKLIFSAIALLVLAVLFWLLATDSGIKLLKKFNFIQDSEPQADITISSANYEALKNKIGDAKIAYGLFIQNVIDFLIIAFCVFIFVKIVNKLSDVTNKLEKKEEIKEDKIEESELSVLKDILKELKKDNKVTNKKINKK